MKLRHLIPALAILSVSVPALRAADIYAIARESYNTGATNRYQFGNFDIDNPDTSGGSGNYVYTFNPLVPKNPTAMQSMTFNTTNSTMYLIYDFSQYRSIDTAGTLSGDLGATESVGYGMSFDDSGVLYGTDMSNMLNLNASTGATLSSSPISPGFVYSSFGGNMAWQGGNYYFADEFGHKLVTIGTNGLVTTIGAFTGTGYDNTKAHVLFLHLNQMYMLNGLNLFTVDLSNGALSKLGSITGVEGDNPSQGFSGATSLTPVPEPSTYALGAIGAGVLAWLGRRRGRRSA
ncbi:PEP-CTERM sorting domain-containing protein [bacterium]|nr:PEP-CTERM sorting domain-containing protein [bacterium]